MEWIWCQDIKENLVKNFNEFDQNILDYIEKKIREFCDIILNLWTKI